MPSVDALTGLPSFEVFTEKLHHLAKSEGPRRLGLCFVDLDRFRVIGQTLGPRVGDLLLVESANRLSGVAGPRSLLARVGADKFAILITDTSCADEIVNLANQALEQLSKPFSSTTRYLKLTASAGVVETSTADTSPEELIREAETALTWAKEDGMDRATLFEPEREARDKARRMLWLDMPSGLVSGEFVLHYQPLVDLQTHQVVGFEALARWEHSELGLLGPDKFISLAEETGLIVALGAELLKQACQSASRWGGNGAQAPYVSVNLAPAQLRDDTLVTTVRRILQQTGLASRRLQLEITEHSVIDTDPSVLNTLHELSGLGIRIALDDFGTGYSNLALLPQLPLSELKLPPPFAQGLGITSDVASKAFLTTVVLLGESLGLRLTAEGIEEVGQAELMRDLGCQTGQGWYFGRPVSADGVAASLGSDLVTRAKRTDARCFGKRRGGRAR